MRYPRAGAALSSWLPFPQEQLIPGSRSPSAEQEYFFSKQSLAGVAALLCYSRKPIPWECQWAAREVSNSEGRASYGANPRFLAAYPRETHPRGKLCLSCSLVGLGTPVLVTALSPVGRERQRERAGPLGQPEEIQQDSHAIAPWGPSTSPTGTTGFGGDTWAGLGPSKLMQEGSELC